VRLLVKTGGFAAGTEAVVVSVDRGVCEIEIEPGRRLSVDAGALGVSLAQYR
jgi:hypothetical protein